jgi:transcriptional regulator GlxA family with amidase domain
MQRGALAETVGSASLRHAQAASMLSGMARKVAILGFDGAQMLDVIGPYETFAAANEALRAQAASGKPRPNGYDVSVVSLRGEPIRGESGLSIAAHGKLAGPVDTLIVAGGFGARKAAGNPRVRAAVAKAARGARRVASVCTGTFVLAAAGLLTGRRATTHWAYCDKLSHDHPDVQVEREPIYVRDGRFWTSAGVTAGIDLALAMIEEDFGRDLSLLIARWLVVFVRRAGGQSQFSPHLEAQPAQREPIRALQSFVTEHPEAALDLPAMASRAGMSVRHFTRVFRSEVGATPAAYVESIRLDSARRLIETTALSVERVAAETGFGTSESLRRAFARGVGLSPREYRARFGSMGGAGFAGDGRSARRGALVKGAGFAGDGRSARRGALVGGAGFAGDGRSARRGALMGGAGFAGDGRSARRGALVKGAGFAGDGRSARRGALVKGASP